MSRAELTGRAELDRHRCAQSHCVCEQRERAHRAHSNWTRILPDAHHLITSSCARTLDAGHSRLGVKCYGDKHTRMRSIFTNKNTAGNGYLACNHIILALSQTHTHRLCPVYLVLTRSNKTDSSVQTKIVIGYYLIIRSIQTLVLLDCAYFSCNPTHRQRPLIHQSKEKQV